jgi:hypothetical protein
MKTITHLLMVLTVSLALTACSAEDPVGTGGDPATSAQESALLCTPGSQMCDYACYYVGGPSTNDCIVQCNTTGTAWVKIQDCGWAQNLPYSSSCYETQPYPVCEWN